MIKLSQWLVFASMLLAALIAPVSAVEPLIAKPNILIIYADDLGYGDLQCYNPTRGKIPTPHIDKLAAQGMRFTDGHSSSAICSPSRYSLLTGRYHWRSRLQKGIVGLWEEPLIAADRLTIAGLLKQQGYSTACIGKWHLGWDWPITADERSFFQKNSGGSVTANHRNAWQKVFSLNIGGGPINRGFDTYFGTDVPNWPPYCFIENDRTVGIPSEWLAAGLLKNNQASTQGPALKDWTLEPILPALADRASTFISKATNKPKPFFLYLSLTSPHTPLAVNDAWKGKSGLGPYADFVMETDAVVGQVLQTLETSGHADDTLVIFTSDNGCAPYIGVTDMEKKGHYSSGPLRGYKSDAWEGGHRIPPMVRWPGIVKAGSLSGQLVEQVDFMATFAEILQIKVPNNAGEDSFSFLPLLKGTDQPIRESAISNSANGLPAVRKGSWKFIPAPGSGGWGTGGDQSQPVQLYNLDDDIGETKNLAAAQPKRVAEMSALLEKIISDGRSTPGPPQKNDVPVLRHVAR